MTIQPALYASSNQNFCTPPEVLKPIYEFKPIVLDPCSNPGSLVQSKIKYEKSDDGLKQDWAEVIKPSGGHCPLVKEVVFVNPPYGREIEKWVKKCIEEWRKGCDIIMLIPARTGSKNWQGDGMIFDTASSICFWKGRIQFYDHTTGKPAVCWSKKQNKWIKATAPFESALIYWGHDMRDILDFEKIFRDYGKIR